MKVFSYNEKEKLKSRKQLEQVFKEGKTFIVFPVKIFYCLTPEQDNIIKTGVGVSSKQFKNATDRNRIKRLLRETYRQEKLALHAFLKSNKKRISLFLLYIDKSKPEYSFLKQQMQQIIKKLINEMDS